MNMSLKRWGLLILAAVTVVRLVFISTTMVVDDEALYFEFTRHLAFGYIDGGATIAFINWFFLQLFGINGFALRIGAVLLVSGLQLYLLWWGTRRIGARTGFIILLLSVCTPAFFAMSVVHTYDTEMSVLMLAALALYYDGFFVDRRWFYPAGIALGIAFFSKVPVIFPAMGIVLLPICVRQLRGVWRQKEFYLSILIALLIFSPFLYWDMTHGWAFVRFKGDMALRPGHFPEDFINVWAAQAGLFLPVLCYYAIVLPFGTLLAALRKRMPKPDEMYFALTAAVPLLFYLQGSIRNDYNANWLAPAFYGGFFLTAIYFGRNWPQHRRQLQVQVTLFVIFLVVLLGQVYWRVLPLPPEHDPTNRYYLYTAFPTEIKDYLTAHPEWRNTRIAGNNYQIPCMVNMYIQPDIEAIGLSLAGYHDTIFTLEYPRKTLLGQSFIFIDTKEEFKDSYRQHFQTVEKLRTFACRRSPGGVVTVRYTLYYVTGYDGK